MVPQARPSTERLLGLLRIVSNIEHKSEHNSCSSYTLLSMVACQTCSFQQLYHCKKYLVKMTTVQVTTVSGFIEQAGSMIKEIPKHSYHPSIP